MDEINILSVCKLYIPDEEVSLSIEEEFHSSLLNDIFNISDGELLEYELEGYENS